MLASPASAAPGCPAAGPYEGSRLRVAGEVHVGATETVASVTALGGPVRIEGRVLGSVVSLGGPITLGPCAEVFGGVTAFGSRVTMPEAARVLGPTRSVLGPGVREQELEGRGWQASAAPRP